MLNKKKIPLKEDFYKRTRAHYTYHRLIDGILEEGQVKIGTTKRGIGPAYADKVKE